MNRELTLAEKANMKPEALKRLRLNTAFRIASYYFYDKGIISAERPIKKKIIFRMLTAFEIIPHGVSLDDYVLELYLSKRSIFGLNGIRKISLKRKKKSFYKDYLNYLASKKWRDKREEAFIFHGRMCGHCGSVKELEVHHLTYKNLFNEPMSDLRILCRTCHKDVHNHKSNREKKIGRKNGGYYRIKKRND